MSDSISFTCACGKEYRVAASYAGREFGCKQCGARLSVPMPGQAPPGPNETSVELGSGGEVMRRTTASGRQLAADPTRVFAKQRENSARMAPVGAGGATAQKSKKPILIAVVALVLLLGGGLGAAAVLGVFSSGDSSNQQTAHSNNTAIDPAAKPDGDRENILKQLDVPGQTAADLVKLLKQADDAELDALDVVMVARKLVSAISAERGAGFSDADLMLLAARLEKLNARMDADTLYGVIIARDRDLPEKPPEFRQAHERLGHAWVDMGAHIVRAGELRDTGVVEGMSELHDELVAIDGRSDNGWLLGPEKSRVEEIAKLIDEAQTRYEAIKRDQPFLIGVARAKQQFSLESASRFGKWETFIREPFVIHLQLQSDETRDAASFRLEAALEATEQFVPFYRTEIVKALGLTRMLPSDVDQAQRDSAPFVIKLFRNSSYLEAHVKATGVKHLPSNTIARFTEPGTGHSCMVWEDETASLGGYVRALVDVILFNYHPHAPVTREEDDNFKPYSAYLLSSYFNFAMSIYGTRNGTSGREFLFFANDIGAARTLITWRRPFSKAANGSIDSLGGQVLTAKDLVTLKNIEGLRQTMKDKIATFDGWGEGDFRAGTADRALDSVSSRYFRGFYMFLYHWGPNGTPKYREKFMKFVRMDLAGEVDADDVLTAFNKAFGLDAAGWKQFESDWTAYQTE